MENYRERGEPGGYVIYEINVSSFTNALSSIA